MIYANQMIIVTLISVEMELAKLLILKLELDAYEILNVMLASIAITISV